MLFNINIIIIKINTITSTTFNGNFNLSKKLLKLSSSFLFCGFRYFDIGSASAASVFLIILVGILTFAHFKLLAKKVHYQ